MRALSPDAADRPPSAADMAAELAVNPATGAASAGRFWMIAAAIASLVAIVAVVSPFLARGGGQSRLTEQDTIVLADFMNTTGEPVFDGALKVALAVALEQSPFIKVFPMIARAGRAAPDEPPDRSAAGAIRRPRSGAARAAESVAGRVDCQPRRQLRDRDRGRQRPERRRDGARTSGGAAERAGARVARPGRGALAREARRVARFNPAVRRSAPEGDDLIARGAPFVRPRARSGQTRRARRRRSASQACHRPRSGLRARPRASLRLLRQLRAVHARPEYSRRAFELRDRVSERERFFISWRYYHDATLDWDKAFELARTWTATYPREAFAFNSLGASYNALGQFDQAIKALETASRLDPSFVAPLESLGPTFIALNRRADLRDIVRRVGILQPDLLSLRRFGYLVAFMEEDTPTMARELDSARRLPDGVAASDWQARTAAFAGRVRSAHDQFRRAVEAATLAQLAETAAQWSASESEMHAVVGQCADTRRENGVPRGAEPGQHHPRAQRSRDGAVRGARRRHEVVRRTGASGFRPRR
jgi:tetratricopeptide (TPR) repeat protein